jgi:hypothetical protein
MPTGFVTVAVNMDRVGRQRTEGQVGYQYGVWTGGYAERNEQRLGTFDVKNSDGI